MSENQFICVSGFDTPVIFYNFNEKTVLTVDEGANLKTLNGKFSVFDRILHVLRNSFHIFKFTVLSAAMELNEHVKFSGCKTLFLKRHGKNVHV